MSLVFKDIFIVMILTVVTYVYNGRVDQQRLLNVTYSGCLFHSGGDAGYVLQRGLEYLIGGSRVGPVNIDVRGMYGEGQQRRGAQLRD